MPGDHSANVLRCYRELLTLIKRLPAGQSQAALREARQTVRSHAGERDAIRSSELLKRMVSKISFLRMTTPRVAGDRGRVSGVFVMRDGELVEGDGEGKGSRVADGRISMSEAWDYHNRLLRRQYFGRDPPKRPEGFF
eukprot:evm.model.scf_2300.2 EVM.evm.TU.scf_2300.2   scf_2300:10002-12780(+)